MTVTKPALALAVTLALTLAGPVRAQAPAAGKTTPAELLEGYVAQAGQPASAERGQKFYATNFGKQMGWSCASCHTSNPLRPGTHDVSEKSIKPLAPAANPARFTDRRQVEFNFKMNCKDVVGRECTAQEKADVIAWLLTLKP